MRRLLLAALLVRASAAFAAFDDLGAGARAPGMGNAFVGLADDIYAIHYNPAGLAQLERQQFAASYSKLYLGLSDGSDLGLSHMAYARPIRRGRWGTYGLAWQSFNLNGVYGERTIYFSYGKTVMKKASGRRLMLGLSAKYMSRSFSALPEAQNACDGGNCTGLGPDPVLNSKGKSAIGADFGLLYRFPRRFQFGLMAQNINQPDVGVNSADKLPMNVRLGLAYKSVWLNILGELRQEPNPMGKTDRDLILALERFFPTLDYGQFGVRGSAGFGSRDWHQITLGLSYRINKIEMDYAFLIPVGTIAGTQGTHRLGLVFHFGMPTAEEEISRELFDQARSLREGRGPGYGYEFAEELRPQDIADPRLSRVRALIEDHQYRRAHEALVEFSKDLPPKAPLVRLANRLELTAYYYREYPDPVQRWEKVLIGAINHFLQAHDRKAVLQASYALNLSRNDSKLDHFLADMEKVLGVKGERLPPDHPRTFIEEMLYRVETANNRGDIEGVQATLRDILDMEPDNATALERVGSSYFVLGKYPEAVEAWKQALPLETKQAEMDSINAYIRIASEKMGAPVPSLPGEAAPAAPTAAAPAPAAAVAPPSAPAARRGDARDVERLYQKGVEHYARGEYLQATAMFMRILQIDPENGQAKKALERIQRSAPKKEGP